MTEDQKRIAALRRRVNKARKFPANTCPASRHLHIMADCLLRKRPQTIVTDKGGKEYKVRYWMLIEEPEHCAEAILAVLASLWEARAVNERLVSEIERLQGVVGEEDFAIIENLLRETKAGGGK